MLLISRTEENRRDAGGVCVYEESSRSGTRSSTTSRSLWTTNCTSRAKLVVKLDVKKEINDQKANKDEMNGVKVVMSNANRMEDKEMNNMKNDKMLILGGLNPLHHREIHTIRSCSRSRQPTECLRLHRTQEHTYVKQLKKQQQELLTEHDEQQENWCKKQHEQLLGR